MDVHNVSRVNRGWVYFADSAVLPGSENWMINVTVILSYWAKWWTGFKNRIVLVNVGNKHLSVSLSVHCWYQAPGGPVSMWMTNTRWHCVHVSCIQPVWHSVCDDTFSKLTKQEKKFKKKECARVAQASYILLTVELS